MSNTEQQRADTEHPSHARTKDHPPEGPLGTRLNRRRLLQSAGAAVFAGPLLAACGSSSSSSPPASSAGHGGGATTALGKQVNGFVGPGGPAAGQGMNWKLGASLPLSGAGAFFGKGMEAGINLAIDHIKQAGGPSISMNFLDNQTGVPSAGVQNVRELAGTSVGGFINSYLADFGAEVPGIAANKLLSIDPGGGTGQALQGKPFFWGSRASWPDAPFEGVYDYVAQAKPQAKRVSLLIWDNGASFVNPATASLKAALQKHGIQLVSVELSTAGATDFSTTVARLKAANPDIVQVAMSGADVAYYLKGAAAGGLTAQPIGADWNTDTAKLAGSAALGYWFAYDYLDPKHPANPWSAFFVSQFAKTVGREPTWLEANYYETTFIYWELLRRVLAKKGNINSGPDLQTALIANPTFKSVYGGNSHTVGTLTFSTTTHSIATRPLQMLHVLGGGNYKLLATFGIDGVDYKRVAV